MVRTIMPETVMKVLEGEIFKTKDMIPHCAFQAGAILRDNGWNLELLKSLCNRNSVMKMITRTLTQEVARPGLEAEPRFVRKCIKCGQQIRSLG
jgi:hypothetical protein